MQKLTIPVSNGVLFYFSFRRHYIILSIHCGTIRISRLRDYNSVAFESRALLAPLQLHLWQIAVVILITTSIVGIVVVSYACLTRQPIVDTGDDYRFQMIKVGLHDHLSHMFVDFSRILLMVRVFSEKMCALGDVSRISLV